MGRDRHARPGGLALIVPGPGIIFGSRGKRAQRVRRDLSQRGMSGDGDPRKGVGGGEEVKRRF